LFSGRFRFPADFPPRVYRAGNFPIQFSKGEQTMSLMRQLNVTINADAIAKGTLAMMRDQDARGDSNETLIRFGLLPAKWMEMIERQMTDVLCERFLVNNYEKTKGEVTTIIRHSADPDDVTVETFRIKDVVSEMLHEVTLALYSNVEMVV